MLGGCLLASILTLQGQEIFTRVTSGEIVTDFSNFRGSSWVDVDNDGHLDMFVVTWNNNPNYLYKNNGDGSFSRVFNDPLVTDVDRASYTAAWGDYDNDGDPDVYIANFLSQSNQLFNNDGNGNFTEIFDSGLTGTFAESRSASWGDYNQDGWLDLFVANANGVNNELYRSNGDGTFMMVLTGVIVNDGGNSFSSNWGDFNNDNYPDLFVANRSGVNFLYQNNGDETFTRITSGPIGVDIGESNAANWIDYDNDGLLDLFVANGRDGVNVQNFLYHNDGGGMFSRVIQGTLGNDLNNTWDAGWSDYDNDGDLDVVWANYLQLNAIYENDGSGEFTKISGDTVTQDAGASRSVSWGDFDNDGDSDLFISNGRKAIEPNFFYDNNGNSNSWVSVKLEGGCSVNRSAIGARVRVKAQINGVPVWQTREISSQSAGRSMNSLSADFGLGDATLIDSLVVHWNATTQTVQTNLAVNQFLIARDPLTCILAIEPNMLRQNDTTSVRIEGIGTAFMEGNGVDRVFISRQSDTLFADSVTVADNQVLFAEFAVPNEAALGEWDLHILSDIDGLLIVAGGITIEARSPEIQVMPDSISHTLDIGDSLDVIVQLENVAPPNAAFLDWSASIVNSTDKTARVRRPNAQVLPLQINRGESSLLAAPRNEYHSEEIPAGRQHNASQTLSLTNHALAYGADVLGNAWLSIPLANPSASQNLGPVAGDWFCGDFDNQGNFLTIDNTTSTLVSVDTANGSAINLGTINRVAGNTWTGLSYDVLTSTWYASSTEGSVANLYVIDPNNVTATVIGSSSAVPLLIDIAVSPNGIMWGHDIAADAMYIIDPSTFTATLIGATGFDANFAQGMDFDPESGDLYLAAYNNAINASELRLVNLSTGQATLVGPIAAGSGVEVAAFGITGSGFPWLRFTGPTAGSIAPGDVAGLTLELRGINTGQADTTLTANIIIESNDPDLPVVTIPVLLRVQDNAVSIDFLDPVPGRYVLEGNYPNPFNPSTTIQYQLPEANSVKLTIYNALGQKVRTLVNDHQQPGKYKAVWNGLNDAGLKVASGIYIYRIEAGSFVKTRRMILLK